MHFSTFSYSSRNGPYLAPPTPCHITWVSRNSLSWGFFLCLKRLDYRATQLQANLRLNRRYHHPHQLRYGSVKLRHGSVKLRYNLVNWGTTQSIVFCCISFKASLYSSSFKPCTQRATNKACSRILCPVSFFLSLSLSFEVSKWGGGTSSSPCRWEQY